MMAMVVAVGLSAPPLAHAASAPASASPDLTAFDRGFRAGQEEFERREYLTAARTWTRAAALLPEGAEQKENRLAIYEYIADAYEKAVIERSYETTMREGLAVLDAYMDDFAFAYPNDAKSSRVEAVRSSFRAKLAAGEEARMRVAKVPQPAPQQAASVPAEQPEPAPPPPAKPWRGLTIGGALAVGGGAAMLTMFGVGAARARSATTAFDDPENNCQLGMLTGDCADIDAKGRRANNMAVAGLITAPLLIGTGAALLVLGTRRKSKAAAVVPVLGRGTVGLSWQGRF